MVYQVTLGSQPQNKIWTLAPEDTQDVLISQLHLSRWFFKAEDGKKDGRKKERKTTIEIQSTLVNFSFCFPFVALFTKNSGKKNIKKNINKMQLHALKFDLFG